MPSHFCLSVRFLDSIYHGQSDGGRPEWPPSPLRVFQALVAAAARRNGGRLSDGARAAFRWLECGDAPVVIAPAKIDGTGYRLSVPNNAMDLVAKAWAKGNQSNSGDADPRTHRSMKAVRPTRILEGDAVHYLWSLPKEVDGEIREHANELRGASGSIVAVGWGSDLAVGHAAVLSGDEVERLYGERWLPDAQGGEEGLRIPVKGTLDDVIRHYESFRLRVGEAGFIPPLPLSRFRKIEYRRATDPAVRPFAAFAILRPDGEGFRPFDAARRGLTVAGMMRGSVRATAERSGWPMEKIASFVLGHAEPGKSSSALDGMGRFAYVPVPTIESRNGKPGAVAGSIRRVLAVSFGGGCSEEIAWARRALSGQELRDERTREAVAILSLIPANDRVIQRYTRPASVWATVSPVVLPGYDDPRHYRRRIERGVQAEEAQLLLEHLHTRIDRLIRRAIVQAGFPVVLAKYAELEWRSVGFWHGTDRADGYGVPDHLKRFPRYHVKVRWRDEESRDVMISGPACIGGGRYYGLGLMAAM